MEIYWHQLKKILILYHIQEGVIIMSISDMKNFEALVSNFITKNQIRAGLYHLNGSFTAHLLKWLHSDFINSLVEYKVVFKYTGAKYF